MIIFLKQSELHAECSYPESDSHRDVGSACGESNLNKNKPTIDQFDSAKLYAGCRWNWTSHKNG
jgi:hypothetical protein